MSGLKARPGSPRHGSACAGVLLFALGSAGGCTPYATFKPGPTSCAPQDGATSAEAAYEFQIIDSFDGDPSLNFFPSTDHTAFDNAPLATMTLTLATPPVGAPCGSATALQIQTANNDDWGSLTGYSNFGPRDASAYEGVSFWAYAVGDSNKSLTILFDDANTYNGSMVRTDGGITPPVPPTANCTGYPNPDGGTVGASFDPLTGAPLSSGLSTAPRPPNGCGNPYQMQMVGPGQWQLVTIPFGAFQQAPTPNRVPNAGFPTVGTAYGTPLLTSRLMTFTIRFPKGVATNLWIDNLAFYRHKGWMPPVGDGGVGPASM